jgi:GrpB-like predicted nucleotidyltransferase (UPF0157 family)
MEPTRDSDRSGRLIKAYPELDAACEPHDVATFEVARRVGELIVGRFPHATVEHIGSTAVAGLSGKGVVDLLLLYPPGGLERAKGVLSALGFQPQGGRDPWPESRPMRIGAILHGTQLYRLHVHVVARDADEVGVLCGFRDRLRADPALRDAYVARKCEILTSGIRDPLEYSKEKEGFFAALRDPTRTR